MENNINLLVDIIEFAAKYSFLADEIEAHINIDQDMGPAKINLLQQGMIEFKLIVNKYIN